MLESKWVCLGLLVVLFFVPAQSKLFDCEAEYCNYNGTTELWNCHYVDCEQMPDWIKNYTFENVTRYNITDCDMSVIDAHQDIFINRLDARWNFTQDLKDKVDSLDNCHREIALLIKEQSLNKQFYVNKTDLLQCQMQRDVALNKEPEANWSYVILALVGGGAAVYFFKDYKSTYQSDDTQPSPGKTTHSPSAVDAAIDRENLKAARKEVETYKQKKERWLSGIRRGNQTTGSLVYWF
jgi:hypothetical protein